MGSQDSLMKEINLNHYCSKVYRFKKKEIIVLTKCQTQSYRSFVNR